jgi:tetratricopeptide (TPR) repeat protein
MGFWLRKTTHYWVGVASRYLKEGEPEKALAAVSHLYKFKGKKDQDSYTAYTLAAFFSGLAYVALRDLGNACSWLHNFEEMNPPNKKWLEDLRQAVENLEATSREDMQRRRGAYENAIETLETTGGEKGFLLGKGYKSIESLETEQAIKAFNEVLTLCGLSYPQMAVDYKSIDDEQLIYVSFALLGLVLSYSSIAQFDEAKKYLGILDRINPNMAEEFRETWRKS